MISPRMQKNDSKLLGANVPMLHSPRNHDQLLFQSVASKDYQYDKRDIPLARPYSKEMFSSPARGNFGDGVAALSNSLQIDRKTDVSNYQNEYSAV